MATATVGRSTAQDRNVRRGAALMLVAALGFIGYGIIFFVLNFSEQFLELGISENEVPVTKQQIQQFSPELFHYISHLHIAVAGFLAALGVAIGALAWVGVRARLPWAWWTAVATAVLAVGIALPAHYPNDFDTAMHLGLIYLAVALFVAGAALSLPVATEERR